MIWVEIGQVMLPPTSTDKSSSPLVQLLIPPTLEFFSSQIAGGWFNSTKGTRKGAQVMVPQCLGQHQQVNVPASPIRNKWDRHLESWNRGWKTHPVSSSRAITAALPCSALNHGSKHQHLHTSLALPRECSKAFFGHFHEWFPQFG